MPSSNKKIPKRDSYEPTPREVLRMHELVADGITASAIFAELQISASVGRRWLQAEDLVPVPYESKSRRKPLDAREAAEFRNYYKTSPSRMEIYRKYNIEKETLDQWLEQLNLEPPKPANARSSVSVPLAIVPERALYQRINNGENEPRRSIADRFRPWGWPPTTRIEHEMFVTSIALQLSVSTQGADSCRASAAQPPRPRHQSTG